MIGFRVSKRYRDPATRTHIQYREGKRLLQMTRYASINNHLGVEESRRDDMESLGYMLAYQAKGSLPWSESTRSTKSEKRQRVFDKKMSAPLEDVCYGAPSEVLDYLKYCRSLRFDDQPNYVYLQSLFDEAIANHKYGNPSEGYDWCRQ